MTLPRVFVQDGQQLQGAATHRRIRDEVPRPNVIPMCCGRRQSSRNTTPNDFAFGRRHAQAFVTA
jgi:hypothetical protein